MTIKVKNWSAFQHYKDRKPPWIKLYKTLLDDHEYAMLEPEAAKYLPLLWLLASESDDGALPQTDAMAYRLRITHKACELLIKRLGAWLYDDASIALADSKQDATCSVSVSTSDSSSPKGDARGGAFHPPSAEDVTSYAMSIGYPMDGAAWCDVYEQKGWMTGRAKMKDWKAAVRNWKRNDWKPVGGFRSEPTAPPVAKKVYRP